MEPGLGAGDRRVRLHHERVAIELRLAHEDVAVWLVGAVEQGADEVRGTLVEVGGEEGAGAEVGKGRTRVRADALGRDLSRGGFVLALAGARCIARV